MEGVRYFTLTSLREMLRDELTQQEQERQERMQAVANNAINSESLESSFEICPAYDWGGKLRRHVYFGWKFPRGKVKTVCDLFMTGTMHEPQPVRPYRKIILSTLPRDQQCIFSQAEYVFRAVRCAAVAC